jgi:hypothetical protein
MRRVQDDTTTTGTYCTATIKSAVARLMAADNMLCVLLFFILKGLKMKLELTSKLLPASDKFAWVHIAKLDEREAELKPLKPFPALAQKHDLGLPRPSQLEEYLREDAWSLVVHEDGSTEETPLREWAKKPCYPLSRIIDAPWWDNHAFEPSIGACVWVQYKFFDDDGSLLAEVGVDSETPMHIKPPKGTHHVIMSWGGNTFYFTKEASDVSE